MQDSGIYKVPKFERIKNAFCNIIRFLNNLLFIFFVTIIIVILMYNFYVKNNNTNGQIPLVSAYVIISPSMEPTINVYDAVLAWRPKIDQLKKGDIITFTSTDTRYNGLTVTHRILEVHRDIMGHFLFRTKGDNNTTPDDSVVLEQNIFGKVIFVIPWLGYLQLLLTKSYGWILFVILPCIFIILYDILKLLNVFKHSKITKDISFKNIEVLNIEETDGDTKKVLSLDSDSSKSTDIKESSIEQTEVLELNWDEIDDDIELL